MHWLTVMRTDPVNGSSDAVHVRFVEANLSDATSNRAEQQTNQLFYDDEGGKQRGRVWCGKQRH